jgi:uracil-DNA glycosylase family 4
MQQIGQTQPGLARQLLTDGAQCWKCPLANRGFPRSPVGTEWLGPGRPDVALVGEAPGRQEIRYGRPFVGPSGKLLEQACTQGGLERRQFAILNAAACGPIPSHLDDIKNAAVAACRPRLVNELKRLQPKVILAVGAKALEVLAEEGTPGVTSARGAVVTAEKSLLWHDGHNWKRPTLFSTFHPAHIMRGGDGEQEELQQESSKSVDMLYFFLLYDLTKAVHYAQGKIGPWREKVALFAHNPANPTELHRPRLRSATGKPVLGFKVSHDEFIVELEIMRSAILQAGYYALDTETDGKDSLMCNLTSIAIATKERAFAATWPAIQMVPGAVEAFRELFATRHLRVRMQNGIFDAIVTKRHKLPILSKREDTLLGHHAAFPGLPHKLDQIATQYTVTPPWKAEFRQSTRDVASLTLYNARDALVTAISFDPIMESVKQRGTARVYEVDRQLQIIATHMREVGFYIDRAEQGRQARVQHERINYMRKHLVGELKRIEEPWRKALARQQAKKRRKKDPEGYAERVEFRYAEIATRDYRPHFDIGFFKPRAKLDIVALFEVLRIPFDKYTRTGLPVTDKKMMDIAATQHPLLRKLLHLRDAQNIDALFISGLPIKPDGRVHPDWSVTKITGRWGAGKAQNWAYKIPGWPPDTLPDGRFKTLPNGDWVTPIENPRRQVVAPTAKQVLEVPCFLVHPQVWARAKVGFGRILNDADESQVELRIACLLSGDKFLQDIFDRGLDPHSIFARICFPRFGRIEEEFAAMGLLPKSGYVKDIKNLDKLTADDWARAYERHPDRSQFVIKGDPMSIFKVYVDRLIALSNRLRDLTKRLEYGGIYGAKPPTVWNTLVKDFSDVLITDVEECLMQINARMEGVVRWRQEREEEARATREIREALFRRVRMFPLGNFDANVVYNYPIQAFAASLLARAILRFTAVTHPELVELQPLGDFGVFNLRDFTWIKDWSARVEADPWKAPVDLLINGHDSLIVESDEEDGDRVGNLLQDAMTQRISLGGRTMLFTADAKKKQRWGK